MIELLKPEEITPKLYREQGIELMKAKQTIQELLKINEELADNENYRRWSWQKIQDLERVNKKQEELIRKYQRKLDNRKSVIKSAVRELIEEYLTHQEDELRDVPDVGSKDWEGYICY